MNDMRPIQPENSAPVAVWRLPRRDYWLLPLIFIGTIVFLLAVGEVAARLVYVQDDAIEPCEYLTPDGARYRPFCLSHTKVWEGPWITQQFNACGYRSAEACSPRPAGSLRVVVVGSSTSRGALVNYGDSFAARDSAALSRRCGGLVDFQNLGTEPADVDRIDRRMPEALALKPAAIVMVIGSFDIIHLRDGPAADEAVPGFSRRGLINLLRDSRLFLLMQYYLYLDPAFQIRAFLSSGESSDYVRTPLSPPWRQSVDDFGALLGRIAAQTGSAHVPVLLYYVPGRAQAALAGLAADPAGVDPFVLGHALAREAAEHGVQFFDATAAFAASPDFKGLYYITDGHLREGGHATLAQFVEQSLLAEPAFAGCRG